MFLFPDELIGANRSVLGSQLRQDGREELASLRAFWQFRDVSAKATSYMKAGRPLRPTCWNPNQ